MAVSLDKHDGFGFCGQFHEPASGWQILGNGYRAYNPVLMRFHSPDSLSPFAVGGFNAYAYCRGDPVNRRDPTGHAPMLGFFKGQTFNFKRVMFGDVAAEGLLSLRIAPKGSARIDWVKMSKQDLSGLRRLESETMGTIDKFGRAITHAQGIEPKPSSLLRKLEDGMQGASSRYEVFEKALRSAESQEGLLYITTDTRYHLERSAAIYENRHALEGYLGKPERMAEGLRRRQTGQVPPRALERQASQIRETKKVR